MKTTTSNQDRLLPDQHPGATGARYATPPVYECGDSRERPAQNFKERTEAAPPNATAPVLAAPEQKSCQEQCNRLPRKQPVRSLQLNETVAFTLRTASKGTVRRVLARLRDGFQERQVADYEGISQEEVRAIRCAYFSIVERAVAIVRMEHENAAELIAELEQDVLEQEVA